MDLLYFWIYFIFAFTSHYFHLLSCKLRKHYDKAFIVVLVISFLYNLNKNLFN